MRFSELQFQKHPTLGGVRARVFFPNGWGVSVIRTPYSCGYKEGLYEAAILEGRKRKAVEVFGYLSEEEVEHILREVEERR